MQTNVTITNKPELDNPILIEGLPGLGLVGKLAADHFISQIETSKLGEIQAPYFSPQVLIQKDGTVSSMKDEFIYHKGDQDLIFIVGNHQGNKPGTHYDLTEHILEVADDFGTKKIYTLGGYGTGEMSKEPRIFGAVTHKELKEPLEELGVSFEKTGKGIVGAAGLLLGEGKKIGMKGVCFMGETHGKIIDPRAAKEVLQTLSELLDIEIDTQKLEERAEKTEKKIEEAKKAEKEAQQLGDFTMKEGPRYIR